MFLQETYGIEDCYKYDPCSSNRVSDYTVPSGLSLSFSTDHYIMSSTIQGQSFIGLYDEISGEFEVSGLFNTGNRNQGLNIHKDNSNNCSLYGVSSGTGLAYNINGSNNTNRTSTTLNNNTWYKYRLKQTGAKVIGIIETIDGTQFGEWEIGLTGTTTARLVSAWNVTSQIKEIKVKAL